MNAGYLSSFEIDARLRRVARRQLGLVTVEQAGRVGVDRWALERRRAAGSLETVFGDVMRLTAVPARAEQRILGAGLAVAHSTITGSSAGLVHQLPIGPTDGQPMVSVSFARSARTAGITTIRHRVALPSQAWMTGRVATPDATLVVLPRFVDDATLERCLDHCLAHRLTTVPRVQALIVQLPAQAIVGRRVLLDLLEQRLDGIGHRSRMEQRVAGWLNAAGLRGWRRNYPAPVGRRESVEVDFAWSSAKVALEVSPFFTHGSRLTQERDMERRRLLVVNGWRVVEATDPDLVNQRAFGASVTALRAVLT